MAEAETKTCQNCKTSFVIEPEDFAFYEHIQVPPPTWCPECRLIRRLIWRQDRTLYKDICDLCKKNILSSYHPDEPYTVYCSTCWWSDKWDARDLGKEYDFSKPFFEQFRELLRAVPRQATTLTKSENCRYCDGTMNSKNCYLNFGAYHAEDCLYCNVPLMSRVCVDADAGMNMDHAYEILNSNNIYNAKFVWFSEECLDSNFLVDCKGCTHCFGCINLRNKKYYMWNTPCSKKEYEEKMKYYDMGDYAKVKEAGEKFEELYYKTPRRFAWITNAVDVTGDNIKNAKNCQACFGTISGVENCKYIFLAGLNLKDSYDVGFGGDTSELLYEGTGTLQSQKTLFFRGGDLLTESEYSDACKYSEHLFGCIGIRNKKYCVLNKQYSKEEYNVLIQKIKKHMNDMPYTDKRGNTYAYGEYFPDEISPWTYNESFAYQWFPLEKNKALQKGYRWRDKEKKEYKATIRAGELPNHIKNTPDSIINEIIECADKGACNHECATAFKIISEELKFYRQMNIALPRLCSNCRYWKRIKFRTPAKLWHRKCMREGCQNEFETAYAPERKEIIYCQHCYNNEFI